VGDPESVSPDIFDGDNIERAAKGCKCAGDHQYPFASGKRVISKVRELRTPYSYNDLIHFISDMFKDRLVPVMVRLKPSDIKSPSHDFPPIAAIRAANAPAVKPASMFTTAITEQDWSILASAARPSPM
jgi:hypothetical protein